MSVGQPVHLPSPCLVVLVGPGASGKSHLGGLALPGRRGRVQRPAAGGGRRGRGRRDRQRGRVRAARRHRADAALGRRLTTVVDTLGLDAERRRRLARPRPRARRAVRGGRVRHPRRRVPGPEPGAQPRGSRPTCSPAQLRAWAVGARAAGRRGLRPACSPPSRCGWCRRAVRRRGARRPSASGERAHRPAVRPAPRRVRRGPAARPRLGERLRAIAAAAEDAGFDVDLTSWTTSGRSRRWAAPGTTCSRATTTLAYLAAVHRAGPARDPGQPASRYRNVAHLGKIVATLDVLSGGRAVVRPRPRLVRAGAPGLRLGVPAPPPSGTPCSRTRCSCSRCCGDRAARRSGAGCSTCPRRSATRGRCRSTCRSWSAAAASAGRCGWPRGTPTRPTCGRRSTSCGARRPCCAQHCAEAGRDPAEVALTHLSHGAGGPGRRAGGRAGGGHPAAPAQRGELGRDGQRGHRRRPGRPVPRAGRRRGGRGGGAAARPGRPRCSRADGRGGRGVPLADGQPTVIRRSTCRSPAIRPASASASPAPWVWAALSSWSRHQVVVDRPVDVAEDADRGVRQRACRPAGTARTRATGRGPCASCTTSVGLADVGDVDHLQRRRRGAGPRRARRPCPTGSARRARAGW